MLKALFAVVNAMVLYECCGVGFFNELVDAFFLQRVCGGISEGCVRGG